MIETSLVTANTGIDIFGFIFRGLLNKVRVREKRPSHGYLYKVEERGNNIRHCAYTNDLEHLSGCTYHIRMTLRQHKLSNLWSVDTVGGH